MKTYKWKAEQVNAIKINNDYSLFQCIVYTVGTENNTNLKLFLKVIHENIQMKGRTSKCHQNYNKEYWTLPCYMYVKLMKIAKTWL